MCKFYLLEPLVLLGRATGKSVLWVPLHEVYLGRPRTRNFLLSDAIRPKPGSINVTTASGLNVISYLQVCRHLLSNAPYVVFLRAFVVDRRAFAFPALSKNLFSELTRTSDGGRIALVEHVHDFVGNSERLILQSASSSVYRR